MPFDYDKLRNEEESGSQWTSYSDLFMVLSVVFLLLFVVASLRNGTQSIQSHIEYKQLVQENKDLKQQIKVYDTLKEDYVEKEAKSRDKKVYENLMDKLTLLEETNEQEARELAKQARDNEQKAQALNQYQQIIRNIINANMLSQARIKKRDKVIQKKSKIIQEKQEEIQILETTVATKERIIDKNNRKIESLNDELNDEIKKLVNLKKRYKWSKKKLNEKIARIKKTKNAQIRKLVKKNKKVSKELKVASTNLESAKKTIEEQEAEAQRLSVKLETTRQEYSKLKIKKQEELEQLEKQRQEELKQADEKRKEQLAWLVKKKKKELEQLETDKNNMIKALEESKTEEIAKLDAQRKTQLAQLDSTRKRQLASLEAKRQAQLAAANAELESNRATFKQRMAKLQQQQEAELARAEAEYKSELAQQEARLGNLKKKHKKELTKLEGNVEKMQKEHDAKMAGYRSRMKDLKAAHEAKMAAEKAAFEANLNQQKLSAKARAKKFAEFEKEAKAKESQLQGKLQGLQGKISQSNEALSKARDQHTRYLASIKNLKSSNQNLSKDLKRAQAKAKAKKALISSIKDNFNKAGIKANVDEKTGDVFLSFGREFFESGSSTLKPGMEKTLKKFIPVYSKSLFMDPKVAKEIKNVEIVGFASPTYQGRIIDPNSLDPGDQKAINYNLRLSQQRANSIFEYIFDKRKLTYKQQKNMRRMVKVSGRGFLSENQVDASDIKKLTKKQFCKKYDCKKSQRVIVKFNLRD